MTDELDELKAALDAATPAPDAAKRVENLRLAQENFDRLQGSAGASRPTSESRPVVGWFAAGARTMIHALSSRGGLVATTALVAIGLVVISPQGRSLLLPPDVFSPAEMRDQYEEPLGGLPSQLERMQPAPAEVVLGEGESAVVAQTIAPAPAPMALSKSTAQGRVMSGEFYAPSSLVADAPVVLHESDTEAYANEAPNPLKITAEDPVSTFSIDVDTASYAVVRSSLTAGQMPPAQAVRVEEMINYFPYNYPAPGTNDAPFRPTVTTFQTPWNPETELVHIALQGRMPALEDRPPLNLVFLIDTSGSMQDANKLPLLKQSFRLMLGQLRPEDQVAIVTYAGSAGQVLEPTAAAERSTILAALDRLEAGGSTAGQEGLQQAYAVAEAMAADGEVTRVLLATDGDFNVGLSDPQALKDFIGKKRDSGTYLSVLGFGRGNLDDATMQALAQNGNGQAAYIDTLNEAQKVLVDQLTGALFPIAGDVKVQVEFNPATVAEYRLIGYETRALKREDFNNDKVDAGDIGAGHSVTAIYEVTPVGSAAVLNDPLRYSADTAAHGDADELGFLRLRYKEPGAAVSQLIEAPIGIGTGAASDDVRFSAAMAGFGQLLRGSDYLGDWSWGDAIALASSARGEDSFGYRAEAIGLMRLAESLSVQ
jgi:Ca-activated chloride channel family protein